MGWQWQQLDHMQIICTLLQTDNHASTSPLSFFMSRMSFLPPNQQRQSTEGNFFKVSNWLYISISTAKKHFKIIAFNDFRHCWLAGKKVVRCWRDCLSGAKCKWFACSPADATATPSSLASLKSRLVTHWRSIAKWGGCFQQRLFVCPHDNFWATKCRMMKLGG